MPKTAALPKLHCTGGIWNYQFQGHWKTWRIWSASICLCDPFTSCPYCSSGRTVVHRQGVWWFLGNEGLFSFLFQMDRCRHQNWQPGWQTQRAANGQIVDAEETSIPPMMTVHMWALVIGKEWDVEMLGQKDWYRPTKQKGTAAPWVQEAPYAMALLELAGRYVHGWKSLHLP